MKNDIANVVFHRYFIAQWLRDGSGYPAEAYVHWLCGGVAADSADQS